MSLNLFLLVLAFVLIMLAALKINTTWLSFGWAGVALLVLTQIFGGLRF